MKTSTAKTVPLFHEFDSTPIETSSDYRLKLCFCPLCSHGFAAFGPTDCRGIISWQHICRIILFSLTVKENPKKFFSLKGDMLQFIVEHWYLFQKLQQFRTSPSKWKKAFLDALSHSTFFESGTGSLKKPGFWKLTNTATPWDDKTDYFTRPIPTKLEMQKTVELSSTEEKSMISQFSKVKIEKYCVDAKQSFANALNSLQRQMKASSCEDSFNVINQMKEVQTVLAKTDSILAQLKEINCVQSSPIPPLNQQFILPPLQLPEEPNPFESFNPQIF
ncbi:hypothetical protein EIN_344260 [Entamoeba invadens IP1]|uniref:Uncharacterized protein n=1 Tax=Entamoeba invadens IP1 TaxID=370355 RepID=A0A0A1U361_ENTIV|nr:hypothetical protein EIN_344260 [Entamoeba invadens IP1]ELP88496.1 hypothetical protein EIN_344260 [Entamoeba invadens IP1]|eukprot:XP_004255267.1 hypothetical protein EIN_344260 [Entamoeba invadens IP1]